RGVHPGSLIMAFWRPLCLWLLPIAAMLMILYQGARWWQYTIDDSYITLRHAQNLAAGYGPVFNPGERTEGSSSPLWVFLLGLSQWFHADPLVTAKAIGLASAIGLALLLFATLRRCGCELLIAGSASLGVAALPGMHAYATSGMETI